MAVIMSRSAKIRPRLIGQSTEVEREM